MAGLGFAIKVVEECPYTRASHGVVHIPHAVLAELAGAVWDDLEWLCLLKGKRSTDGLTIVVNEVTVPPQYRNGGICGLEEEAAIDPGVVGVVHSHHAMGAFFSQIDVTTFNTRFPLSIVVARPKQWKPKPLSHAFGFEYLAEGRTMLPCGDLGITKFHIVPTPIPPGWTAPVKAVLASDHGLAGTCERVTQKERKDMVAFVMDCGSEHVTHSPLLFGRTGQALRAAVDKVGRILPIPSQTRHWFGDTGFKKHKPIFGRPAGMSKKEWKRQCRLLDEEDRTALNRDDYNESRKEQDSQFVRKETYEMPGKRTCLYCKQHKFVVGVGTNWSSFIGDAFADGTGVCRACSKTVGQYVGARNSP